MTSLPVQCTMDPGELVGTLEGNAFVSFLGERREDCLLHHVGVLGTPSVQSDVRHDVVIDLGEGQRSEVGCQV